MTGAEWGQSCSGEEILFLLSLFEKTVHREGSLAGESKVYFFCLYLRRRS